jgi:hypothetical protein
MLSRRELMTSGLAGAANLRERGSAGVQEDRDRDTPGVLKEILAEMRRQQSVCTTAGCPSIERIREATRVFLKSSNKYPDYLDVGLDVWEDAYDWHVRHRQPLNVARMPDSRYGMAFMFTTLVLRHEMALNYVGPGYDK